MVGNRSGSDSKHIWKAVHSGTSIFVNFQLSSFISGKTEFGKQAFKTDFRPFPSYKILEMTIRSFHSFGNTFISS